MAQVRRRYQRLNRLLHEAHRETLRILRVHKTRELKMLRGALEAAIEWLDNELTGS